MTTIKDIAKAANVSVATVSMALNDKAGVSEQTKEKIAKLAKEMNYVPSVAAQALKAKKSHNIGIIVGQLTNAYAIDIISAAEEVANQYDYNVFVSSTDLDVEKTIKVIKKLHGHFVDGILLSVAIEPNEELIRELHQLIDSGVNVIALTKGFEGYDIPIVSFREHEQIAHCLTRLVGLGHQHIGLIEGDKGSWINTERSQIFKEVTEAYGMYNPEYIASSKIDMIEAKKQTLELLQRCPEITAIYAINDMLAIGVLQAALELNIKVPEELSIIGSDGISYVSVTTPNISTIVVPRYEMGKIAATKLINMIEEKEYDTRNSIIIPCTFSEGGTIASSKCK